MPSPKSKSPKSKSSPKGKGSPSKSAKEKISPKDKGADEEEASFVYVRPPPPPPPPDPPKGPVLSRLRRQVWYPYANRASFEHREWFWSPYCPLITSWGDIWVSDPQQRRILRYCFDPVSAKIVQKTPPVFTLGEPRIIIEIPRTGRVAALLTCPKAKKTSLVLYDPIELKDDIKVNVNYEASPAPAPQISPPPAQNESYLSKPFILEDDSTPIGMCANSDILFVLFQPIQKLLLFEPVTLKPYDYRLENAFHDESTCVHLASSGGCAANENYLYVAATRPPRVQVFWIYRQHVLSKIDRIYLTWYAELSLDRLSIGEPYGLQLDSLGLLVVSDSRAGFMRVYNTSLRPPGPLLPSLKHGETCYLGSWKIDPYQNVRPGHFSLGKNGTACVIDRWSNKMFIIADRTILRWYDETLLVLDDAPFLRPIIDPLMPINGLPKLTVFRKSDGDLKRSVSEDSLPILDDELIPEWLSRRYKNPEELIAETQNAKVSPGKSKVSPQKSKSPKSKSTSSKKKK